MKKVIVFGPTGRTGLAVLTRASTDSDLQVSAYLRKPKKVPEKVRKEITIIEGDVMDEDKVAAALEGKDVVISCLGVGFSLGATTVISEGLRNVLNGMRKHGIKDIVVVGVSFLMPGEITPFPLKKVGEDHHRAYEILKQSKDINWICMAPPEISNLPYTGTYKVAINKLHSYVVTTHDLAHWMIACVKDSQKASEYKHQLVGISSSIGTFTWLTQTHSGVLTLFTAIVLVGALYFGVQYFT